MTPDRFRERSSVFHGHLEESDDVVGFGVQNQPCTLSVLRVQNYSSNMR